jgi:hypothetical protein
MMLPYKNFPELAVYTHCNKGCKMTRPLEVTAILTKMQFTMLRKYNFHHEAGPR